MVTPMINEANKPGLETLQMQIELNSRGLCDENLDTFQSRARGLSRLRVQALSRTTRLAALRVHFRRFYRDIWQYFDQASFSLRSKVEQQIYIGTKKLLRVVADAVADFQLLMKRKEKSHDEVSSLKKKKNRMSWNTKTWKKIFNFNLKLRLSSDCQWTSFSLKMWFFLFVGEWISESTKPRVGPLGSF